MFESTVSDRALRDERSLAVPGELDRGGGHRTQHVPRCRLWPGGYLLLQRSGWWLH